jgi:hypothetical protein
VELGTFKSCGLTYLSGMDAYYRPVNVREGDKVVTLPAIQAVMRSQVALAAKGNGPAQRTIIETIQAIEREIEAHVKGKRPPTRDHFGCAHIKPP